MNDKIDKIEWRNEKWEINKLKRWERNPRKFSERMKQQLEKSIDKFNFVDPIVVNVDGTIIGGHFRISILKEKGIDEVDVRVPNRKLTEEEVRELSLRLNKNVGDWDEVLLRNYFDEGLLASIGWEEGEISQIFLDFNGDVIDDDFIKKEEDNLLKSEVNKIGKKRTIKVTCPHCFKEFEISEW